MVIVVYVTKILSDGVLVPSVSLKINLKLCIKLRNYKSYVLHFFEESLIWTVLTEFDRYYRFFSSL